MKTEVAAELLQALGYGVKQSHMNTPFVLRGLADQSIDVALGLWDPLANSLMDPLVKQGKVVKLTANLSNALSGLAVPAYVHEAGVNTVADLNRYADRFDHKIYGIEAGSTYDQYVNEAIKNNTYDLGQWNLVASSAAVMLAQVKHDALEQQWIVFYAWRPHWMNVAYDLYYLKLPKNTKQQQKHPIVDVKATVYTLLSPGFASHNPNLKRFFAQYRVSTQTQSQWVYAYSHENKPETRVARTWIKAHPQIIKRYLAGVTTVGHEPGFAAVQAAFKND